MQSVSSITMIAPVPSSEPAAVIDSKSRPTSRCSSVSIGVEDPPGVHAFSAPPAEHAAGVVLEQRPQRGPERQLVVAGPLHLARDAEDLRAGRLLGADLGEPLGDRCVRMCGTVASVSTLLIRVGEAYRPSTAGNGGRSRGWPRYPSSEDEERGLLAADVGAGAAVQHDLELEPRARARPAEHVLRVRLGGSRESQDLARPQELAAAVHERQYGSGPRRRRSPSPRGTGGARAR